MRISKCTSWSIKYFSNHYHQPGTIWRRKESPRIGVVGGGPPDTATCSNLAIASLTLPCVTDLLFRLSPDVPVNKAVFGRFIVRSGSKDRPEGINRFDSALVAVVARDLDVTRKDGDWNAGTGGSISNSNLGDQISLVSCRDLLGVMASMEF